MTWDAGEDALTHVALRLPSPAARPSMSQNSSIRPQMSRLGSKATFVRRACYKTPELLVVGAILTLQRRTHTLCSPSQVVVTIGKGCIPPAFPPSTIRVWFFF